MMPPKELHELVSKTLADLGIEDCADTLIGGALIKGIPIVSGILHQ